MLTGLGLGLYKWKMPVGAIFTDADAEAYYNALATANGGDIDTSTIYGIDLETFQIAINTLFVSAKNNGYYSNLVKMYPFVGGTAATHAINAINATSELTYVGSPTHNGSGMVCDGVATKAVVPNPPDTYLQDDNNHICNYVSMGADLAWNTTGVNDGSLEQFWIRRALPTTTNDFSSCDNVGTYRITATGLANDDFRKVIIGSRTSSTSAKLFHDAVEGSGSKTNFNGTMPNFYEVWIGSLNNTGVNNRVTQGTFKHCSLGDGLTDAEVSDYTDDIKAFNVSIGRDYVFTNSEAENYWNELNNNTDGGIDCPTLYGASNAAVMEGIDNFVSDAKSNGYWGDLIKVFPFIGGTDTTHAINLVDATSVLTYNGSPSHSANGMELGGSPEYADMNTVPSTDLTASSTHIGIKVTNSSNNFVGLGSRDTTSNELQIIGSTGLFYGYSGNNFANGGDLSADRNGFHLVTRRSTTDLELYTDAVSQGTSVTTDAFALPTTYSTLVGAWNNIGTPGYYTAADITWATYGDGLTDAKVSAYNSAINTLQTILGR